MNNLMLFENQEVEVLSWNDKVLFNPYHVGNCLDLTASAVRKAILRMNDKQVLRLKNSDVKKGNIRKLNNAGENFLTESGMYKLVFRSNKPKAEKFTDWVTDEVLPIIRETGKYELQQPKINREYTLEQKTYKGLPIMLVKDISYITGIDVSMVNYYVRQNDIHRIVLGGEELKDFKEENPSINYRIGNLTIFDKEAVEEILLVVNKNKDCKNVVDNYFKVDETEKIALMKDITDKYSFKVTERRFNEMLANMNLRELVRTKRDVEKELQSMTTSKKVRDFFFNRIDFYIDKLI